MDNNRPSAVKGNVEKVKFGVLGTGEEFRDLQGIKRMKLGPEFGLHGSVGLEGKNKGSAMHIFNSEEVYRSIV